MYSQHACVHFSFCPHPVISAAVPLFFPSLVRSHAVREAGLESKVQVCRLADESQRGSVPPTVCKYVVTLIERSSSSQQLSFLLFMCVCLSRTTAAAAGDAHDNATPPYKRCTCPQSHITDSHTHVGPSCYFEEDVADLSTSLFFSLTHTRAHTEQL